jgi:hypothetical protein
MVLQTGMTGVLLFRNMKKIAVLFLVTLAMAFVTVSEAKAGGVSFGISVGHGYYGDPFYHCPPAYTYYHPYYGHPAYYHARPVYYRPARIYYTPRVYRYPSRIYYGRVCH